MVALTASLSACTSKRATTSPNSELRIGAILSLSGTYASMGKAQQQTLELEAERINAAGGINGKTLKLIIEDDGTSEAKAVTAATKLIMRDKVEVILAASGTGASMAIRSIVEENKVPQLAMAGGSVITSEFSEYVFQTPWTNELLLSELFDFLSAQGYKKLAFVSDSGGYGKDGLAVAQALESQKDIELVLETSFKPQDTDMSSQVALVKSSDADAVIIWNAGKEASLFVNQALISGLDKPLFGGSGLARMEFSEAVGSRAEGLTILTGKSFIPKSWSQESEAYAINSDFAERFEARYGVKADIFAGHAYDALHLALNALDDPSLDALKENERGEEIKDVLETKEFTGYGGLFRFSESDHNGLSAEDISFYHIDAQGEWALGLPSEFSAQKSSEPSSSVVGTLIFSTLKNAAFYTLIALGFLSVFMATSSINFAQGEFVALAGLIAASLIAFGTPLLLSFLLTLIFMLVFGFAFHRLLIAPLSKSSGTALVIVSVGASILLRQIALHIFGPDELKLDPFFSKVNFELFGTRLDAHSLILIASAVFAVLFFVFILSKTRFGKAMRAYANEREGALLCGINPQGIVGASFVLAGLFSALAGLLITPLSQMSFDSGISMGIKGFSVAILGGLSNPIGAPLAALVLASLESISGVLISPTLKEVVAFIILLAVLIFRPQGLFSRKEREKF